MWHYFIFLFLPGTRMFSRGYIIGLDVPIYIYITRIFKQMLLVLTIGD